MSNKVVVGLDLGQKRDHSAIAVIEREEHALAWMPNVFEAMKVRHLERLPLGTPYTRVVERVSEIMWNPRLGGRKRLVADATGVGAPIVDLLRRAHLGCTLTAVTITGGDHANGSGERWNIPKRDLLTGLLVLLEQGQLKIVRQARESATLVRELAEMEMRHRPGGGVRMGAEGAGRHDDLVIAVALACWGARRQEMVFGTRSLGI